MKKLLLIITVFFVVVFISSCKKTEVEGQSNETTANAAFMKKAEALCDITPAEAYKLGEQEGKAGLLKHQHGFTLCTEGTLSQSYQDGVQAGKQGE